MKKNIPNIKVPIIKKGIDEILSLQDEFNNKKIILFGVPGAFTPTCSEKHLPDYIKSINLLKNKGISNIYCLSVNDKHVMKAWLLSHTNSDGIIGIADGNAEVTKYFNIQEDKSSSYMGLRSSRFAMIIDHGIIKKIFIEKQGEYKVSTPSYIIDYIDEQN